MLQWPCQMLPAISHQKVKGPPFTSDRLRSLQLLWSANTHTITETSFVSPTVNISDMSAKHPLCISLMIRGSYTVEHVSSRLPLAGVHACPFDVRRIYSPCTMSDLCMIHARMVISAPQSTSSFLECSFGPQASGRCNRSRTCWAHVCYGAHSTLSKVIIMPYFLGTQVAQLNILSRKVGCCSFLLPTAYGICAYSLTDATLPIL